MVLQTIVNILFLSCVYLLLAKGFELIYKTSGVFNLVYAIAVSLAAYFSYTFGKHFGFSLAVTIPLAIVATTLLMVLIDLIFVRPLIKSDIAGWSTMVVTLFLYSILETCQKIIWGDNNLLFYNWKRDFMITVFGSRISLIQIITILISILVFFVLFIVSEKTLIGKRLKACSLNSELGTILGINKEKVITNSYVISCILASIAGIAVAIDTHISPNLGFDWIFLGVIVMIIGGMGKMRHVVFGALFLATIQNLSDYFFGNKWMNAIAYIILVVFLCFRPYGFSGKKIKKTEI